MNFYRQNRVHRISMLSVLLILFVAACGRGEGSPETVSGAAPIPAVTPEVAYGASLTEWEESTQGEGDAADSGELAEWPFPADDEASTDEPVAAQLDSDQVSAEEESTDEVASSDADEDASSDADEVASSDVDASSIGTPFEFDNIVYQEILWDGLIPADFTGGAIMAKYQEELDSLESGSPEMSELYSKMQDEFNNAPVNEVLNEVQVRIPGFVTPLEYDGDLITEFLLVPNLGACIHVPPPPVNQTVMVTTAEGQGIKIEDSYSPIWVMGTIVTEGATTDLATAGYNIQGAVIEQYTATE